MKHSYAYILLLGLAVLLPSLTSCGQKPVTDGGLVSVQYEKLPQGEDLHWTAVSPKHLLTAATSPSQSTTSEYSPTRKGPSSSLTALPENFSVMSAT